MAPLMSSHSVQSLSGARAVSSSSSDGKTKPASRLLSKVNSFSRNWDDEPENKAGSGSSSNVVAKSSDTAPVTTSSTSPAADASTSSALTPLELAKQRRRAAIMAALNSGPGEASTSSSSGANGSKSLMPWQESLQATKRKADADAEQPAVKKNSISIKAKVVLSSEQQRVLQAVVTEGKSIFFTGSAGTGKSVLLREIIASLRKKYVSTPDAVAVTASTGIAACNIGGITLHSFGGFGLGLEEPKVIVGKMRRNKKAISRWMRTKVLIIDEISMVDADLFDKLSAVGSLIRKGKNSDKPFGGIQVVVTGDFFQLPPVTKGGIPKFAFEAETWKEAMAMSVNLTKVFRQKDQKFVDMLNEMRFGRLSATSIAAFKKLARTVVYNDGIEPTELFPMRHQVENANRIRMTALNTEERTYLSVDAGEAEQAQREKILDNFMALKEIKIRVDAQVMLIKNMDEQLVNGSMGKVIGFCYKWKFPMDARDWTPDLEAEFEDSEVTSLNAKILERYAAGGKEGKSMPQKFPVVRFKLPNAGGFRTELITPTDFKTELPTGGIQASRSQLPLIPAWAMSIHKSQGQTLDRVKVDLQKVFEKGQAYVALSRATSLEGLQLTNFRPETVKAHPKVTEWSLTLMNVQ